MYNPSFSSTKNIAPLLVVVAVFVFIRVAFLITEPLVLITFCLFDNLGVFSQMTGPLDCFSLLPSDTGTY